jgi:hypothetical protein
MRQFDSPFLVATSAFACFGVMRYMQLVMVETGADDPTSLVLRDPILAASVVAWGLSLLVIIYGLPI